MKKMIVKRLSALWLTMLMVFLALPLTAVTVSAANDGDMIPLWELEVDGLYAEISYADSTECDFGAGEDWIYMTITSQGDGCGSGVINQDFIINLYNDMNTTATLSFDINGVVLVDGEKKSNCRIVKELKPNQCVTLKLTEEVVYDEIGMGDFNLGIDNIEIIVGAQTVITETVTPNISPETISIGESFTVAYSGLTSASPSDIITQFRKAGSDDEWSSQIPLECGTYDVRGYIPASVKYAEYCTQTSTLVLSKNPGEPKVVWPTAKPSAEGVTLAEVELVGGSTELGTFEWVSPESVIPSGTSSCYVKFTPSQTTKDNYTSCHESYSNQITVQGISRTSQPSGTVDYWNGIIKNLIPNEKYEIRFKALMDTVENVYEYTADSSGVIYLDFGSSLYPNSVRLYHLGDGTTTFDSEPQELGIGNPLETVLVATVTDESAELEKDGSITISSPKTECTYFWRKQGDASWQEFSDNYTVSGLGEGFYEVRACSNSALPHTVVMTVKMTGERSSLISVDLINAHVCGDKPYEYYVTIKNISNREIKLEGVQFIQHVGDGIVVDYDTDGVTVAAGASNDTWLKLTLPVWDSISGYMGDIMILFDGGRRLTITNVYFYRRVEGHKIIEFVSNEDGTHSALCSYCNENVTTACRGGYATCTQLARCVVCRDYYGSTLEHSFTVPQHDETQHWNKCENCNEIDTKQAHLDENTDGICDTCGTVLWLGKVEQVSVTLDGDIGVNFYWTLVNSVINDSSAYFLVTLPNGDTETIKVSEAQKGTPIGSSTEYYKITGRVAAKEMAEDIKVELFDGNNTLIESANCSVRGYAQRAFAADGNAELITMMKAMLNYGAASQVLFDHNTDDLANSILENGDKTVTAVTTNDVAPATLSGSVTGIKNEQFSCILETKTTLRHYFSLTEGEISDYTFALGGVSVTPVQTVKNGKTMYYVDIPNISAKDLGVAYAFTITKGEETQTISASVQSYMSSVIRYSSDASLIDAVNAMYAYNKAAIAYFPN